MPGPRNLGGLAVFRHAARIAVPILTTLKVIADGYPRLMPLAEFLGR
jgi:hypothetical protein